MITLPITDIRTDGGTQPRAQMDLAVIAEYTADIADGATFPPVTVYHDGAAYWLADGFHRLAAYKSLGLTEIPADVKQGTLDDARWYSYSVNQSHGLRRTNDDKRRAVEAALAHPYQARYSNYQIARHCGVSEPMVRSYRDRIYVKNVDDERVAVRNGQTYSMNTANIGRRETPEPVTAPADLWAAPDDCPDDKLTDTSPYSPLADSAPEPVIPPSLPMAVHYSSASPSWNTPRHVVDLVLAVLGEIDLDPCSNSHDAPNVPAFDHYTEEDDGLAHTWLGRVYMNPPYGDVIGSWVTHLLEDYAAGNVSEAIALVPARTDTQWFAPLWDYPCCFVRGRLRFNDADPAPFPSVAVYLGPNAGKFVDVFNAIGVTVRRM